MKDKNTTLILKPKSNKRQRVIIVLVVNYADNQQTSIDAIK